MRTPPIHYQALSSNAGRRICHLLFIKIVVSVLTPFRSRRTKRPAFAAMTVASWMLAASAGDAHSRTVEWFTVVGDLKEADTNTVQVDPQPVRVEGAIRFMDIRVNRATPRQNWDGVPYRSFRALVEFDCVSMDARYREITYFMHPFWTGEPARRIEYSRADPRPMRFRDMQPNPMERIVKAACAGYRPG